MKINHNMSAIIANNQLKKSENRVSSSVEKLSSGLRINHAGDDPAGMAISQKMKSQIRGLSRASDNASDGISVIETAEGALTEVHSILNRMRELAVQSANGTYDSGDREAIQKEIDSLSQEVDRIATDTQFNGVSLLDGSLDYRGYTNVEKAKVITFTETVPDQTYRITMDQQAKQAESTQGVINAIPAGVEGSLTLNGETIYFNGGESAAEAKEMVRALADRVGVSVTTDGTSVTYTSDKYGSAAKIDFSCESPELAAALGITTGTSYGQDTTITLGKGFEATASYTSDGTRVEITDRNGFVIELDLSADIAINTDIDMDLMHIGAMNLQIGANENETMTVKVPSTSVYALDLENLNFLSQSGSGAAITALDGAVDKVSSIRASLGAYQNRLEHSISSLDVSEENMTSAMSRIEDADMAEEMSEYTAASVIEQAGVSVLSQANDVPQMILQLLN